MESSNEKTQLKPQNMYVSICVAQVICIAIILISLLIIKFFFKDSFIKIGAWCKENALEQREITAFLQEEIESET